MVSGRKLIEDAVASGLTDYAALSRAAGKNHAYMQQFVTRSVPRQLPEDVRAALAPVLGCSPDDLREGDRPPLTPPPNIRPAPNFTPPTVGSLPRDFPIYGTAAGSAGDGAMYINQGDVVDYVRRPPGVAGNRNAYGLYVEGESMVPALRHGALIVVDPGRKARVGDLVVVIVATEGGSDMAYVKELVRNTAENVIVKQYNPAIELSFKRDRVRSIQRVLDMAEAMGMGL